MGNDAQENKLISIAERYSDAIIEVAKDKDELDKTLDDLKTINSSLAECPELKMFLEHPTLPNKDKKDTLQGILKDKISNSVLNFLMLLIDKNRLFAFNSIVSAYEKSLNKIRNISIAKVTTAVEIDEDTKNKLKAKLEELFKKEIKLELMKDTEIIAGMVVEVEEKTIDGSIRTKIDSMKKQLL